MASWAGEGSWEASQTATVKAQRHQEKGLLSSHWKLSLPGSYPLSFLQRISLCSRRTSTVQLQAGQSLSPLYLQPFHSLCLSLCGWSYWLFFINGDQRQVLGTMPFLTFLHSTTQICGHPKIPSFPSWSSPLSLP